MIDLEKMSEGIDYELIPADGVDNDQAWQIRILRGEFPETILRFGNLAFNDDETLSFNFFVVSSPDDEATEDNVALQNVAGGILEDVLTRAVAEGGLVTKEKDDDQS